MRIQHLLISSAIGLSVALTSGSAAAQGRSPCSGLPSQAALQSALDAAVANTGNGGLGFNMWGTIVAIDGTVCAVAFSGKAYTDQWLASRVISAQKASTANSLSLGTEVHMPAVSVAPHGLALSTANLYSAVQPGGTLYGLQHSNPVDAAIAYDGPATLFGAANDPLVGNRVGGINVFGGGLVLLTTGGVRVGGLGVSGDTSCTDHFVAWRVRHALDLDHFGPSAAAVGGVSGDPDRPDNIILDFTPTADGGILNPNPNTDPNKGMTVSSVSGFGHPVCDAGKGTPNPATLPPVQHN